MLTVVVPAFYHHVASRLQHCVCLVFFVTGGLTPGSWPSANVLSTTLPYFPDIEQHLESVAVDWGEPHHLFVGGVPISTLPFVSSHSAIDVASRFSSEASIFQRVLSMPGQLILSGVKDRWHWIAVLQDGNSGASGYVSAMSGNATATLDPPAWLLPGLSAGLSISNSGNDQAVVQHVHHLVGSHGAVRDRIKKRLSDLGWKRHSDSGDIPEQWHWHRNGERLSVMMLPHSGGTLVLTQQQMRGIP